MGPLISRAAVNDKLCSINDEQCLFKDARKMRHGNNVYSDPAYAKIVQETKQELVRLQKLYGDVEIDKS